jgi:threonine/homoserine efflux transporter RhtA
VKKGKFSKTLIVLIVLLNIVFTAAVLIVFSKTSSEPTALVGCWFAFTTTELWALASIKKSKIKKKGGDNDNVSST